MRASFLIFALVFYVSELADLAEKRKNDTLSDVVFS